MTRTSIASRRSSRGGASRKSCGVHSKSRKQRRIKSKRHSKSHRVVVRNIRGGGDGPSTWTRVKRAVGYGMLGDVVGGVPAIAMYANNHFNTMQGKKTDETLQKIYPFAEALPYVTGVGGLIYGASKDDTNDKKLPTHKQVQGSQGKGSHLPESVQGSHFQEGVQGSHFQEGVQGSHRQSIQGSHFQEGVQGSHFQEDVQGSHFQEGVQGSYLQGLHHTMDAGTNGPHLTSKPLAVDESGKVGKWTKAGRALMYGFSAAGVGGLVANNISEAINPEHASNDSDRDMFIGAGLAAAAGATYGATRGSHNAENPQKTSNLTKTNRALTFGASGLASGFVVGHAINTLFPEYYKEADLENPVIQKEFEKFKSEMDIGSMTPEQIEIKAKHDFLEEKNYENTKRNLKIGAGLGAVVSGTYGAMSHY